MSLDQLQAFIAVVEEGSVRKAAARLHISQPPLTRKLSALEDELGAPLFTRRSTGMSL
ncbi:MAG TPA: LysR family transcriptional regulator, partial [Myxococcota bacterium]